MVDMFRDVGKFHAKFELPRYGDGEPPRALDPDVFAFRMKHMEEELREFEEAYDLGDLAEAADALADLVWVALGTGHFMRLPMSDVWREVQRANMTKVRAAGDDDPRSKRGHRFDVVKPPGFVPPDHGPAIEAARCRIWSLRCTYPNCTCGLMWMGDGPIPDTVCPRPRYPSERGRDWWDRWYLDRCEDVATASKDPSTKVGAIVVGVDKRDVAWGYNGFPPGIEDDGRLRDRAVKYGLIMHAERNALDNARFDVVDGTLYCQLPPCVECAKSILSRRIRRVVTSPHPLAEAGRWTEQIQAAQEMLREAGVESVVVE